MSCRTGLHALALVALAGAVSACAGAAGNPAPPGRADVFLPRDTVTIDARVPRDATLDTLLTRHGLRPAEVFAVVAATRQVFDPRRLRADRPYRLVRELDGTLRRFHYEIDGDRFLEVASGGGGPEPVLDARIVPFEKQTTRVSLRAAVDSDHPSLVAALDECGERVELAVALADILGGEVDFNSELQAGDTLDVVFEKRSREGQPAGYGVVLAAELRNDGRLVRAFRFVGRDGKAGYYDDKGRSLRRFFLKSPLPFLRVTSRFSRNRLHPVHNVRRAHLGVDYGAPVGTPVVAVASGIVVSAGFSGEAGRMLHIRHASGYESLYLHLSSFAPGIARGVRVDQGEVIGRVGSSGTATGPHLDYRLRRNGAYLNPLTAHRSMPPGTPVDSASRDAFFRERDHLQAQLAASTPVRTNDPARRADQ